MRCCVRALVQSVCKGELCHEQQELGFELEPVHVFGQGDDAHDGRARDGDAQSKREKERKVPGGGGSPRGVGEKQIGEGDDDGGMQVTG